MITTNSERDVYIDPVSHEAVDPKKAAGRSFYNGYMYHFTANTNKETFDEDPGLWVSTPHASLTSSHLMPVADE